MVSFFYRLAPVLGILGILSTTSVATAVRGPPSRDPFYKAPPDIERFGLGQIVRVRPPPSGLEAFGVPVGRFANSSHQIMFRTSDGYLNATAAVATIIIPPNANFSQLLSLQVAEDSASPDCGPSFGFQAASNNYSLLASPTSQLQLVLAEAALDKGWIVVVADAEGPKGAYPPGALAAHITLDAIRAALGSGNFTRIDPHAVITLMGYSGGGSTTLRAAQLQGGYAPGLNIAGAAIGGASAIAPDLADSINSFNKSPISCFLPITLLGVAAQYPGLEEEIAKHLKPQFKDQFYKTRSQCLEANKAAFRNQDISTMFDDPKFLTSNEVVLKALKSLGGSRGVPGFPLSWFQLQGDKLVPTAKVDESVEDLCDKGVSIMYQKDSSRRWNHATYGLVAAPQAFAWLEKAMDGRHLGKGCTTRNVTTSQLDPAFLSVYPETISSSLSTYLELSPA